MPSETHYFVRSNVRIVLTHYVLSLGFAVQQDLQKLSASYPHLICFQRVMHVIDLAPLSKSAFPQVNISMLFLYLIFYFMMMIIMMMIMMMMMMTTTIMMIKIMMIIMMMTMIIMKIMMMIMMMIMMIIIIMMMIIMMIMIMIMMIMMVIMMVIIIMMINCIYYPFRSLFYYILFYFISTYSILLLLYPTIIPCLHIIFIDIYIDINFYLEFNIILQQKSSTWLNLMYTIRDEPWRDCLPLPLPLPLLQSIWVWQSCVVWH